MLKLRSRYNSHVNRAAESPYEVLIVGAGPGGLFAALSCAAAGMRRVLVIDGGPDVEERRRPGARSLWDKGPRPEYERGVGGAGLFSDGKLCLSLGVGGHLDDVLGATAREELEAEVEAVLLSLVEGPVERREANGSVADADAAAQAAGLAFKYYPVAHIGTERCTDVIRNLRALLVAAGIEIRARRELVALELGCQAEKLAELAAPDGSRELVEARNVVLALGKVGAPREAALCAALGVELGDQRLYGGLRFEAPAAAVKPLFGLTKDPKYSLSFPDGTKIKTHCATDHGEVLTLRYSDLPLAGGHSYSGARTDRSGFSILWDGIDPGESSYETALAMMRRAAQRTHGQLTVQRLADLRTAVASQPADLAPIPLTCREAVPGDLRKVLPHRYFERLDAFLKRLTRLAPELTGPHAVAYGPAFEWWMKRIAVSGPDMRTVVPGLSVCGDGSGWSQGIAHAAATGLLAAIGIHGQEVSIARWVERQAVDAGSVCA